MTIGRLRMGGSFSGRAGTPALPTGTLHSIASLARVVGPIAIGLAGETVGFQGAFLGAAVLALAAGAVGLRR